MELGFRHRALEAEQQAIIEVRRIVDAVFIENQGLGEGAHLQQPMPVARVPGQARHLQAQHDADARHPHFAHQLLEALAIGDRCGRLPLVAVDHDDLLLGPAERDGPATQRVLTLAALRVLEHLPHGRLPDVQVGGAPEVMRTDLLAGLGGFRHHHALLSCR